MTQDDAGQPPADISKIAVALKYRSGIDVSPIVTATGRGWVAEKILELARLHNVEVREDADLAKMLSALELDAPIPLEAYMAVAEILAYIYRKNDEAKRNA